MLNELSFTIVHIGTLSMNKFWGETERVRNASTTCTLLRVGGRNLLVDPSPYPEELEALLFARTGLSPTAIDQVFITHWHGDHRFGLELFGEAQWLMASAGLDEWRAGHAVEEEQIKRFLPAEDHLPEGVVLWPAPGHTQGLHTLLLDTEWGPLMVAGDAVMTPEFFEAEEGFHNSVDFGEASRTIRRIKATAALVIPGHGNLILNLNRPGA